MNNLRIRKELEQLARDERERQTLEEDAARMDTVIAVICCAGLVIALLLDYFA